MIPAQKKKSAVAEHSVSTNAVAHTRRKMGTKPKPRTLPTPVRLLARLDGFIAPKMICVPDAFALPSNLSGRVFAFSLSTTRLSSSRMVETAPPPPMMPAEPFSGEPMPRLQLFSKALRMRHVMRNITYHVPVNGRSSCAQKAKGVLDE